MSPPLFLMKTYNCRSADSIKVSIFKYFTKYSNQSQVNIFSLEQMGLL